MTHYQDDIEAIQQLKDANGSSWHAIDPEAAARMRAQNRFRTGLEIARYTANIMRRDMAEYDADSSVYTQSLGVWHGFIGQQKMISIKKHLLEELPGLGKKTVTEILNARKAGPFKDFEDLKTRVPMLKDPVKLITDRIILEISDRERRHYIFIVR